MTSHGGMSEIANISLTVPQLGAYFAMPKEDTAGRYDMDLSGLDWKFFYMVVNYIPEIWGKEHSFLTAQEWHHIQTK